MQIADGRRGLAIGHQPFELALGSLIGSLVAQQAARVVKSQNDRVELVGELVGVEVGAKVPLALGQLGGARQAGEPLALV